MTLILQDDDNPSVVLDAILSLADAHVDRIRIAVAYTTIGGSELLVPQLVDRLGKRQWDRIVKTIVTSIDYGITDWEALEFWRNQPRTTVRVANADLLERGNLNPARAFHLKIYLFNRNDLQSYVMGSANLTQRALTINREIVVLSQRASCPLSDADWNSIESLGTPLNDKLLGAYREQRRRHPPQQVDDPPPPAPLPSPLPLFRDEVQSGRLDPARFSRFWVEAGTMGTSDSHNALEVPRYANRFFGFQFDDYGPYRKDIDDVTLRLGGRVWTRKITWHGAKKMNHMERLLMPTIAKGGLQYAGSAVMFRRTGNEFEFEVADWNSPLSVAWRNSSIAQRRVYRLGGNSKRICGLI